jgi:transposase InsO family protein
MNTKKSNSRKNSKSSEEIASQLAAAAAAQLLNNEDRVNPQPTIKAEMTPEMMAMMKAFMSEWFIEHQNLQFSCTKCSASNVPARFAGLKKKLDQERAKLAAQAAKLEESDSKFEKDSSGDDSDGPSTDRAARANVTDKVSTTRKSRHTRTLKLDFNGVESSGSEWEQCGEVVGEISAALPGIGKCRNERKRTTAAPTTSVATIGSKANHKATEATLEHARPSMGLRPTSATPLSNSAGSNGRAANKRQRADDTAKHKRQGKRRLGTAAAARRRRKKWLFDCGATSDMVGDPQHLHDQRTVSNKVVVVADGSEVDVRSSGRVYLSEVGGGGDVVLKDTLLVPSPEDNLISISKFDKDGYEINIKDGELRVWKDGVVKAEGVLKKGLYELKKLRSTDEVVKEKAVRVETLAKWHQLLGHLHHSSVLKTEQMVDGMTVKGKEKNKKPATTKQDGVESERGECEGFDRPDRGRPEVSDAHPELTVTSAPMRACTPPDTTPTLCEPCVLGKMHALPFPRRTSPPSTAPLQLVHTDLCGPFRVATPAGHRYFITFIDDYSKYTVVRLLRRKAHASQAVKDFHEEYTKALGLPLKIIRSDNGGEYVNDDLQNWLKDRGVAVQLTTPHTPEQNGTAERTNRTVVEMLRTMMIDAGASMGYWGECALYTAWIRNRVFGSSCPEGKTPFEGFFSRRPSLEQAHPWGCLAFAHVPDATRHKLQPKAVPCIFIGVSDTSKAWRLYDRTKRKVVIARSVVFDDNVFPMRATTAAAARPADLDLLYREDEIFHFERSPCNTSFEPYVRDNQLSDVHDAPIDLTEVHDSDERDFGDDMGVGESLQSIAEDDEEQVEPTVRRSSRVQQPSRELIERVANALQVQDMVAHGHGGIEPKRIVRQCAVRMQTSGRRRFTRSFCRTSAT